MFDNCFQTFKGRAAKVKCNKKKCVKNIYSDAIKMLPYIFF